MARLNRESRITVMITVQGCDVRTPLWSELNHITKRVAAKDSSIWGEAARAEASIRLGWVDLPESSRDLLPTLDALSAWSREIGHTHFILCGMGGSSLAPEVIAATYGKDLVVLDSTEPKQVLAALECDLSKTCIIIGSKSGSTIETASHKALFYERLQSAGLDPKNHMVIVTDPGSPLDKSSRREGLRTINADPHVGGRFSALSAFGLTPAALIGVDVSLLLDDAFDAAKEFTEDDSSVVRMAALLAQPEFAFVGFCDSGSPLPGLSDWIEQLIAESTGKDGRGVLPVVAESADSRIQRVITFDGTSEISASGPLGAQFIFWEWVTALLGYALKVDPFNQPNVTESKERTMALLENWSSSDEAASYEDGKLAIYSPLKASKLEEYIASFIDDSDGYIAIMAYLDRIGEKRLSDLRRDIERRSQRPTTFGWGPRFLHSTGQFHKGGPQSGRFIQITSDSDVSCPIPGKDFGFERLIAAQARGDLAALTSRGLPVLRIHLKDREAGITKLLEIASKF